MNEFEDYLRQLEWELRDLPNDERAEIVAEMRTHIEAGMDEGSVEDTAVSPKTLIAELGSPAELAQNLRGSNWKRNAINASLALIPLLLLNPLNTQINHWWGYSWQTVMVTFAINIFICLGMVIWAYWRRSGLLCGWWLANAVGALFAAYTMPVTEPVNLAWSLLITTLLVVVAGFYGRFLWQNRLNGLLITLSLTPLLWGFLFLMSVTMVFMPFHFAWRMMLMSFLVNAALVLVVLVAFLVADRYRQWLLLIICNVVYAFAAVAVWWPNPTAVFLVLLLLPIMLGFCVELAAYRAFRKTAVL